MEPQGKSIDSFQQNIDGVTELVQSGLNKDLIGQKKDEGISGSMQDKFSLDMDDKELLEKRRKWEDNNASYDAKIDQRAKKNKTYLLGLQKSDTTQDQTPIASNMLFEAQETFIPQSIAKNPEPVVYSDNTPEGKAASNDLKAMLQYHAIHEELQRKLGMMIRHWSVYFIGIMKHGWDSNINPNTEKDEGDITSKIRKPKNFILDKDGYIDEFGTFVGEYLGEKLESTAGELIDLYPDFKEYITIKVSAELGTPCIRTEWWTDEFTFTTFEDKVLEKHKNPFFNYSKEVDGEVVPGNNHFSKPCRPYTFFSVFTMQEQPHDMTNLIEQNLKNQDRITVRDDQIDQNLKSNNNSIVVNGKSFENMEQGSQAGKALQDGDIIWVPNGNIEEAIHRIAANDLPGGILQSQEVAKDNLRGVFGVQGVTAQAPSDNTTAHGMVLNQEYDSTRIGGGVGSSIEATARNIFNWWTQLYYVFYDEPHFAAVIGQDKAVEYVTLQMADMQRHFIVTVAPNSMAPKDEISERTNAVNLASEGLLDPITLFQTLDYPDPMATAKKAVLWKVNPQLYLQTYFPEQAQQQQQTGQPLSTIQPQSQGSSLPEKTQLGQAAPLPKI